MQTAAKMNSQFVELITWEIHSTRIIHEFIQI